MNALLITNKKTFLYEEKDEEKNNIFYIDEPGIKNTLRN
jgi:hypothetical protein